MASKSTDLQATIAFDDVGDVVEVEGGYFPVRASALCYCDGLALEVVVGMSDAGPGILRFTVLPPSDARITPALMRRPWQPVFDFIVSQSGLVAAMRVRHLGEHPPGPSEPTLTVEERENARQAVLGPVRRRSISRALLRQVAEIAAANPDKPTEAVSKQLCTGHRNATRWIAAARKAGILVDGFSQEQED